MSDEQTDVINDSKAELNRTISRILVVQSVVSGVFAMSVVVGAIVLSLDENLEAEALVLLQNWGGVIIGFYFGTAFTQISGLLNAVNGTSDNKSGQGK